MIFWLTYAFFASQIFAGLGLLFWVASFQFKKRQYIIGLLIVGMVCVALQFIFLERYVWAAIIWIWIVRYITSLYYPRPFFIPIFIVISALVTAYFWKDMYDILPFLSATINTIWIFQVKDKNLRKIMMLSPPILILYYFFIFSPVGILLETIFLGSNILGYYRYYINKK